MASLDSRVGTLTDNMVTLASEVDNIDANQVSLDYFAGIKDTLARIEADQESFRYIL